MSKKILFSICFVLSIFYSLAQTGTIRGTVYDEKTGETVIGATVVIKGTINGTITDFDGNYSLKVEPGIHDVVVSFVSYEAKTITDIAVEAGKVTITDCHLGMADIELTEVIVTAKENKRSENAMITLQRKSAQIMDGISAEQISKLGDSNAAAALKRVTGVSVQSGKYVFIRGLGDRYTKTTLNGAEIPSLDPEKNSVQMDLFPSNIIDNIVVRKTFTPDMPGESTGGLVDIVTRDFPDKFTLVFSNSIGYNTQSSLNDDFLTQESQKFDWLGMDNGERGIPSNARNVINNMGDKDVIQAIPGYYTEDEVNEFSNSFDRNITPITKKSFLNHSHKLSFGNQLSLGGSKAFGFNAAFSYSRNFSYYDDGRQGIFKDDIPSSDKDVIDRKGEEKILLSGLLNLSLKLNSKNKVGVRILKNQAGTKVGRYRFGSYNYESGAFVQDRERSFLERKINSYQLHGKHTFERFNYLSVDWQSSYTKMIQNEPDAVFFSNVIVYNGDMPNFYFKTNELPNRLFRNMNEYNFDNKLNIEIPVNLFTNKDKIKVGVAYLNKDRRSELEKVELRPPANDATYNGNYELDGNIESFFYDNMISSSNIEGSYYMFDRENNALNAYSATSNTYAAYFMLDFHLTDRIRLLGGARYEKSEMKTKNLSTQNPRNGEIMENDILPSLNLTYSLIENMNLRLAYSQTIARPQFREFAPANFYDYKYGRFIIGNPDLKRTKVNNIDLRWEYYSKRGEMFAVSGFYKIFDGAIEPSLDPTSQNFIVTYKNTSNAYLYGVELEVRKSLDFIDALKNFNVGGNLTLVKSSSELEEQDPKFIQLNMKTRNMVGQAPYVANVYLGYDNKEAKLSANLGLNVNGDKMTLITAQTTPYIYEKPQPMLTFNISKGIKEHWEIEFSVDNILDSQYRASYNYSEDLGSDYDNVRYSEGVTFGLSLKYFIK